MKRITGFLFSLLFVCTVFAQGKKTDAMLFGHVQDKETGEHIPYATIVVKGTNKGTSSDITGHFKLANLPLGKQTIIANFVGYKPLEMEVEMKRGESVTVFFELEEDVFNLDQVVVTGTRTPHYIKNVPVRTEVVTSQALKNKNAWNLFEALEGIPGVRVESQCQFCNFSMVRMQGLGAEHTQVLIDGQPIYSGLAGIYGLEQIGTGNVDRIEVVKGAGSALYGSSAVAGAINIITKEPLRVPSLTADIQMGNHGTNVYNLNGSMSSEDGNIGLNIYAQKIDHGAIDETGEGSTSKEVKKKDGISDRVESKMHQLGFGLYINNPFFRDDRLVLKGKTINEYRAGGKLTGDYYKNPFSDGTENITTNRYEGELNYIKPLSERSKLTLISTYANHNREATNDAFLGDYQDTHDGANPDILLMRPYIAKEHSWVSTLMLSSRLQNHGILFGLQHYATKLDETGMYVVVDEESSHTGEAYKSIGKKHAQEFGAFLQDEWTIGQNFTVVPGVRIDHHASGEEYQSDKEVFDQAFPKTKFEETSVNPRVALKYNLNKHITLRANAGTGFRAPYGFSEDLHLCSGSPRVWKSSELKPETSRSFNLSADYYGHHIQFSANAFYTFLKNKIDFGTADDKVKAMGYTYQWENVDDAVVKGVEMSLLLNPVRNLNMGIDFTLNDGKYKNPREDWKGSKFEKVSRNIPRFAQTTGSVKLEYTPKTWTFMINGLYQGKMFIDYLQEEDITQPDSKIKETKPFMTFNAKVSKQLGAFNLYAGAKNIFSYIQDEKHLDDAAFIYAPLYGALWYGGISVTLAH